MSHYIASHPTHAGPAKRHSRKPGIPSPFDSNFVQSAKNELNDVANVFTWQPLYHRYVSDSLGDDANDGLTEATPWKTIDKVRQEMGNGNILPYTHIHLRRGDEWVTDAANDVVSSQAFLLNIDVDNVAVIGDWGFGPRPLINKFVTQYDTGWTNVVGNTYSRTETANVGYVRLTDDRLTPFYRASDTGDVSTQVTETSGSFYHDSTGNLLYVDLGGTDPNTQKIEMVTKGAIGGIAIEGSESFVKEVRVDGYGLNSNETSPNHSAIRVAPKTDKYAAAINCEAYYTTSVAIWHRSQSYAAGGGIGFIKGCRAGFMNYSTTCRAYGVYVQYVDCKTYMQENEAWGCLPTSDWYGLSGGRELYGNLVFGSSGSGVTGRALLYKCVAPNVPFGCESLGNFQNFNMPDKETFYDADVHFIFCRKENTRKARSGNYAANAVRFGCYNYHVASNWTGRCYTNVMQAGLEVNCHYHIVTPSGLNNSYGFVNDNKTTYSAGQFVNCKFVFESANSTLDTRFVYDGGSAGSALNIKNCIFAIVGTYDQNQLGTGSPPYTYCAFNTASLPGSADANCVLITDNKEVGSNYSPVSGDVIYKAGTTKLAPKLDRFGNRRGHYVSIGDLDDLRKTENYRLNLLVDARRETVDPAGNYVYDHQLRTAPTTLNIPLPNYQTYISGVPTNFDILRSGWDKNGEDTILLARVQSTETMHVYKNDTQVNTFQWTDVMPSSGYTYKMVDAMMIHYGLIVVLAKRELGGVNQGVSMLVSQDYGQTWEAQDFPVTPGYTGANMTRHWCLSQPYPTVAGSDALSASIAFSDYIGKSDNPNGGSVFFCPIRRKTISDEWTVGTCKVMVVDQKTGDTGRHIHGAAVIRGDKEGIIYEVGDVHYRNETRFLEFSLGNYLNESPTPVTVYGGWSDTSTLPNMAPQPVSLQPGPTLDTYIVAGDESNPVVGIFKYDSDGHRVVSAAHEDGPSTAGNKYDAPAYLRGDYLHRVGYWYGGGYFSPDGYLWGRTHATTLLGHYFMKYDSTSGTIQRAPIAYSKITPFFIAPGGTNYVDTSTSWTGNPAPSSGVVTRQVKWDGFEFRFVDDNSLLSPQPPKPPFPPDTNIYYHDLTNASGRNVGNSYPGISGYTIDFTNVHTMLAYVFNMAGDNGISVSGKYGSSSWDTERALDINSNSQWISISEPVNPNAGSGRFRAAIYGDASSTSNPRNSKFLYATVSISETAWPTYPMQPYQITGLPDERVMSCLPYEEDWTFGIKMAQSEMRFNNWSDTATNIGPGIWCIIKKDDNNYTQIKRVADAIKIKHTVGGVTTDYELAVGTMFFEEPVVVFIEKTGSAMSFYARKDKQSTFETASTTSVYSAPANVYFTDSGSAEVPSVKVYETHFSGMPFSEAKYFI